MALKFVVIMAVVLVTVGTIIVISSIDILKALAVLFKPWAK